MSIKQLCETNRNEELKAIHDFIDKCGIDELASIMQQIRYRRDKKIDDLDKDLTHILEIHTDTLEFETLFHYILKFMTKALYDTSPTHTQAYSIWNDAINEAIQNHCSKHL